MGSRIRAVATVVIGFVVALVLGIYQVQLSTAISPEVLIALEFLLFVIFAVVFVYAATPELTDTRLQMRRRVFFINGLLLTLLFGVAVLHYKFPIDDATPWLKASLHAIWFAMLGSVAISFRGVYEHPQSAEWDEGWWLWYLGRPFTGAIVGSLVFLLLQVANPKEPPLIPSLAVAAFIFGTQESRFFGFLYQVGKLVLTTPADTQAGLTVAHVLPTTGAAGDPILLTGTGIKSGATAYLGPTQVAGAVAAPDGTSLAGVIPAGAAGQVVDVIVSNPDGTSFRINKAFTFQ